MRRTVTIRVNVTCLSYRYVIPNGSRRVICDPPPTVHRLRHVRICVSPVLGRISWGWEFPEGHGSGRISNGSFSQTRAKLKRVKRSDWAGAEIGCLVPSLQGTGDKIPAGRNPVPHVLILDGPRAG